MIGLRLLTLNAKKLINDLVLLISFYSISSDTYDLSYRHILFISNTKQLYKVPMAYLCLLQSFMTYVVGVDNQNETEIEYID
jgi:hypothetical protein